MTTPLPKNIQRALEYHFKKYGTPPNIVEHSILLGDMPPVDGVEYSTINIPANILLIGVKS